MTWPPPTEVTRQMEQLATTLARAQKTAETAEIETGRLREELIQSSDRERDVRATARKVVKDFQVQLEMETSAHQHIEAKVEGKI